jgi:cold shock CspA family protein
MPTPTSGTIKKLTDKGFGFIAAADGTEYFFHQSACTGFRSVTEPGCNLAVGCGHGQFPRPIIRADGTFDVDGTYRIEVGPVSTEPAPPAHFSGSITDSRLILTVIPTAGSLQPASYSMTPTGAGTCPVPCV